MITIDLSIDTPVFHGTDIKKSIVKGVVRCDANVVVYGKDIEKVYQTINNMVKEIPPTDRCILCNCNKRVQVPENSITLKEIEAKMSSDDLILETFKLMPDRVVMGIVDDSVRMNLLLLYLSEGYSSIILGVPTKDGESLNQAIQSLLCRMKNSIKFEEAPEVLVKFLLDNIHIGIKLG